MVRSTRELAGPGNAVAEALHIPGTDRVYFLAEQPTIWEELWATDPALSRVERLTDFDGTRPDIRPVGVLGSTLLFGGGGSLWRTDGSRDGTEIVRSDVSPSGRGARLGPRVLFPTLRELWISDGTPSGTERISDVFNGFGREPLFLAIDGMAFFFATHPAAVWYGIWRSDGTAGGTTLLYELPEVPKDLLDIGGELLVVLDQALLRLDPADGAVEKIEVLEPGEHVFEWAVAEDRVFLSVRSDDYQNTALRVFSWETGEVTELLSGVAIDRTAWFTPLGDRLVFVNRHPRSGDELWVSDGSVTGTRLAFDIVPGSQSSFPAELAVAGDHLFFEAQMPGSGTGLWAVSISSLLAATGDPIPPQMQLLKELSEDSDLQVGGVLTYVLTLTNEGAFSFPDIPGDELRDVLPASLELVDAYSATGIVRAIRSENTVTWNGAVGPGQTIVVTIDAIVRRAGTIANQAELFVDLDGDEGRDVALLSEGPRGGATVIVIQGPAAIPVGNGVALMVLALAMLALGLSVLRGRMG